MSTHNSFQAAREQAADYLGFAASERIEVGDKVFEIPNPSLLDDDQQARVDALDIEMDEEWDRHPDVKNDDGTVAQRGALKLPHRKGGQPMNYNVRLAQAIFGKDYDEFRRLGGRSSDVQLIWSKMNRELAKRREDDSKSGGSAPRLAAVPEPDSD